jgi:hypothetical protein
MVAECACMRIKYTLNAVYEYTSSYVDTINDHKFQQNIN